MEHTRTENARRNIISSFLGWITGLLLPFLIRIVLISRLSADYLGLTGLFFSIFAFLSLADLGIGTAIAYLMYKPIAEKDTDTICALLNLFRKCYRISGCVILILGICLIPFLPNLISGEVPEDIDLTTFYLIMLFNTCIGYLFFEYKSSLFYADQRNDILNYIGLGSRILTYGIQLFVLINYSSFYLYCIALPVTTMIRNLLLEVLSRKIYPQYVCRGKLSSELLKDLKSRTAGLFIGRVSSALTYSLDDIILSAFLGLLPLAKFMNYNMIDSRISEFMISVVDGVRPSIGNSLITESQEKNYHDLKTFQLLYMWINGWAVACLFCLFQPFIRFWVGADMLLPDIMVYIFCLYYISRKMNDICFQYRNAAGLWWKERHRCIVAGISNVLFDFILVQKLGIAGVLLSTILYQFIFDLFWGVIILFRNYFTDYTMWDYLKLTFYCLLATAIGCLISGWACGFIPVLDGRGLNVILTLLERGILATLISNVILWLFYSRLPEYKKVCELVKKLLHRNFSKQ